MAGFGGMSIRIDHPTPSGDANPTDIPPGACCSSPAGGAPLAAEAAAAVTQYGPVSLHFVRDRHDLGLLLLADAHVHRGRVWSFAPTNNEPARIAQARGEERVARWPDDLFRQAVADWAKQYSKATGIDLSDLARLKRKRPEYPEVPEPHGSRGRRFRAFVVGA